MKKDLVVWMVCVLVCLSYPIGVSAVDEKVYYSKEGTLFCEDWHPWAYVFAVAVNSEQDFVTNTVHELVDRKMCEFVVPDLPFKIVEEEHRISESVIVRISYVGTGKTGYTLKRFLVTKSEK